MSDPAPAPLASVGTGAPGFKREMSLFDAMMIVIGAMIGSGIFIVSADIARTVGSPGLLVLVWVITGVVTVIGALSYGELAGMMPHAGGLYVYLREAYNPLVGFLYGWTTFLVIQTGTIAAVGVAFAKFTGLLIPWFSEKHILATVLGLRISAAQLLAIASIVVLTWLNMRGVRTGKTVQGVFTVTKTVALAGFILLGLFVGANAGAIKANLAAFWKASWTHMAGGQIASVEPLSGLMVLAAVGAAMVGSLFASDAWYTVTYIAGEVKNPKRNIPLSLVLGAGTVVLLYVLANIAYILILPVHGSPEAADVMGRGIQFASFDRVGTAAAEMIFGPAAAVIMAVLIMIATFGCNNGLILSGARVYYAMARDGLFFTATGRLNRKAVPGTALVVQCVWASLLCLSGTYSDLLDYVVFAVLIFFVLVVSGIFILRKKRPDWERPYKAWGYPVLPALYVLAAAAIAVDLLVFKTKYTFPGLLIVLLGIPVYFARRRFLRPAAPVGD
ncbi:MAG TPA: amino acid permease [Candidatus Aminicenantes bacterium]|nr:amino acid permease [Candidatus Aminicenantes bacterium]HRY65653.1 amino acid permease [Candidatus Aminicenantes bacterium]HRZ72459.1 amino acid permease [Candidatus Aminicenantes bacterium]